MFYRELRQQSWMKPPPILSIELLRTMSAAVINEAMRKLPDPNKTEQNTVSIERYVDYHGKVKIEFELAISESGGNSWRFWTAKSASKVP